MKSIEEIRALLVFEICKNVKSLRNIPDKQYYNDLLGDTSYLMAGYLGQQLKYNFTAWDSKKWIDDALITKVSLDKQKLSLWGVIIWGIDGTTEQWTDPFYFHILLNQSFTDFTDLSFLFGDLNKPEIGYEKFKYNRGIWDKDYYADNRWDPSNRNWRYIISAENK